MSPSKDFKKVDVVGVMKNYRQVFDLRQITFVLEKNLAGRQSAIITTKIEVAKGCLQLIVGNITVPRFSKTGVSNSFKGHILKKHG